MSRDITPIDVGGLPELLRIAREVRRTNEPRMLRHRGEDIAVLAPVPGAPRRTPAAKAPVDRSDDAAFLAAAGSWRGLVDGEKHKAAVKAARGSRRPRATL